MPASILFNTSNTYERLLSRNSSAENNRQYCLIYMNDRNGEPADEGKIFAALRSSHRKCYIKKAALKSFSKFTGKQRLFFNIPSACNFIEKETLVQVFPVNFAKVLRKPFLRKISD